MLLYFIFKIFVVYSFPELVGGDKCCFILPLLSGYKSIRSFLLVSTSSADFAPVRDCRRRSVSNVASIYAAKVATFVVGTRSFPIPKIRLRDFLYTV